MAISVPQTKNGINTNIVSAPFTASFTSLPATGNGVIVSVCSNGGTSCTGVTDNQTGNTYTQIVSEPSTSQLKFAAIFYCPSITAPSGTFTVSASFSAAGTWSGSVGLMEVSGLAGTSDQTGVNNSAAATALTITATGANTTADSLVVSAIYIVNNTGQFTSGTMPAGYTAVAFTNTTGQAASTGSCYKIVAALETSSAAWSWTTSGLAAGTIATFQKQQAVAAPPQILMGGMCL